MILFREADTMRLESVRALKAELFHQTLTRARATREMLRDEVAFHRSALPVMEPPPPIALGIEGRAGEYRLAVRIQEASPGLQTNIERIFEVAHGEASVKVVGRMVKQQQPPGQRTRNQLLRIGCSIGHVNITAGTLGGFVEIERGTGPCILSNNHVLADEDRANLGDPILQPGPFDGGSAPQDAVATLSRAEPLRGSGKNLIDVAVAVLRDGTSGDFDT